MNTPIDARHLAIILAAGEGTRMRSSRPKVLHEIAGRPLVGHALAAAQAAGYAHIAAIVGPGHERVAAAIRSQAPGAQIFEQTQRLGTAHAVLQAREAIARGFETLLILFGDTPLVTPETMLRLRDAVLAGHAVAVLGFRAKDPTGYGRLLVENGALVAIREHKDASEAERATTLCNGGLMALSGKQALAILERIDNANAQREYYLPDAVAIARQMGMTATVLETAEEEILGVNDRVQLAGAEKIAQRRYREAAMRKGVTLIDPDSVFFSYDTEIAQDVIIEPQVVFGPQVRVESGAVIHAFSHLAGAHVGPNASVGPFARLRPGTVLGAAAKIGNFVETKNADVAADAKISHLSYIGDARVGQGANIGAGTITCNYDGFNKHVTEIGAGAFVGSNSALVAPVAIGAGAFVGSGSVITKDVPEDALAIARGRQENKDGWAKEFRAKPENQAKTKPKEQR